MVAVGRVRAVMTPMTVSTPRPAKPTRRLRRDAIPTIADRMARAPKIPARSAFLSFAPKVRIAKDFNHSGVASMKVWPTVRTGEAAPVVNAAARCPAAKATAVVIRPVMAPAMRPGARRSAVVSVSLALPGDMWSPLTH